MSKLLTPKQVAQAIDASESSVKRWCDKGTIPTQYTAGGHRRIAVASLLAFLRASKYQLVRPDVLDLPVVNPGSGLDSLSAAAEQLTEALIAENELRARQIVLNLYLAEHSVSAICDQVIAVSFEAIGDLWECGAAEVYQERLSCEVILRLIRELRSYVLPPQEDGPVAIGGAIEGDQYNLATTMVELVLRDQKWRATSLGDNLPFDTLRVAIQRHRPRLFWLSVSHMVDVAEFVAGYSRLYDEFGFDVAFALGGRALSSEVRQQLKYAAFCDNLAHLEAFAQTLYN